jgi:hypothetical protein
MTANLFYNYPPTALIRFCRKNVLTNGKGLYKFKTQNLEFVVPEKLCIKKEEHICIPNSIYQDELLKYYKTKYT